MKQKILTTCFALACSAALLSAQSTQSTPSNTGQTDRSAMHNRANSKSSITLQGCLQAGTEPNTFMLNNVSETGSRTSSDRSGSSSQSGSSSTPSEMARSDASASYTLVPNNKKIDLSKHIGQRVEVTGTIVSDTGTSGMHSSKSSSESSSSSASSSSSTGNTGNTSAMSSSDMSGHQLKVRSIRQISSTCP